MVAESTPSAAHPAATEHHRNLAASINSSPRNHQQDQFNRWKSENNPPASIKSVKSSNGEQPQPQPRRSKSREVSSRYMFPTASSIAAAAAAVNTANSDHQYGSTLLAARRSPSPNSQSRRAIRSNSSNGNASDQTNASHSHIVGAPRSVSAERRRPPRTDGENAGEPFNKAAEQPPGRLRGSVGGLWPPSSSTSSTINAAVSLPQKFIDNDNQLPLKKDVSSNYSNLKLQQNTALDKSRDSNHVHNPQKVSVSNNNNNSNNNPEQRIRCRTPERPRTPSRRSSAAEENGKRSKENIQNGSSINIVNGRPDSGGGAINRASSLKIQSRASIRDSNVDLKLSAGGDSVNLDDLSRLSVDSEYNQNHHHNILLKRRGTARSWSSGQDIDSTPSPVTSSDGGGSTPRYSTTTSTSTSSGSGSEVNGNSSKKMNINTTTTPKKVMKGSYVPARFLQDTLSRLRRLSDAGGHMTSYMQQRLNSSDAEHNYPIASSAGAKSFSTAISMSVISSAPSTGNGLRGRLQSYNSNLGVRGSSTGGGNRMSSMLNVFAGMELFKGSSKRSAANTAAQEEVMHHLRLLQNRYLQWRFINARSQAAHQAQIASAQNSLYNVWCKISELRSSVVTKRIELQQLRNEEKVTTVVAAHAAQLEDWASLEEEHASALTEAMECLDAAIVRVPLVAGAKADVRSVKQVLDFAVDVMYGIQAAGSRFLPQAEKVDSLLPKLAESVIKERALLQECVGLVAGVASMEVEERSLRTHLIQLQQQQQEDNHE